MKLTFATLLRSSRRRLKRTRNRPQLFVCFRQESVEAGHQARRIYEQPNRNTVGASTNPKSPRPSRGRGDVTSTRPPRDRFPSVSWRTVRELLGAPQQAKLLPEEGTAMIATEF